MTVLVFDKVFELEFELELGAVRGDALPNDALCPGEWGDLGVNFPGDRGLAAAAVTLVVSAAEALDKTPPIDTTFSPSRCSPSFPGRGGEGGWSSIGGRSANGEGSGVFSHGEVVVVAVVGNRVRNG